MRRSKEAGGAGTTSIGSKLCSKLASKLESCKQVTGLVSPLKIACHLLLLAEAVNAAGGLRLERGVEAGLHEDDFGCGGESNADGGGGVGGDAHSGLARAGHRLELADQPVAHRDGRLLVEGEDCVVAELLAVQSLHHVLLHLVKLREDHHTRERVGGTQRAKLREEGLHLRPLGALACLFHCAHADEALVRRERLGRVRVLARGGGGGGATARLLACLPLALRILGPGRVGAVGVVGPAVVARLCKVVCAATQPRLDALGQGGWLLVHPRARELRVHPIGYAVCAGSEVVERALIGWHVEQHRLERGRRQREGHVAVDPLALGMPNHQLLDVVDDAVGERLVAES